MVTFKNYVKIADNHYCEHFGLDFEQFVIGQKFQHRPGVTISQQDNAMEALDTINNAQLHYDAHYAAQTEWRKCLGVSTLTLQKVIGMTSKTFARKNRIIEFIDIAMTHPIFGGDTIYAESEIINIEHDTRHSTLGIVTVITNGINQHNDIVASIKYKIQIYKANQHPVEIANHLTRANVNDEKFSSHQEIEPNIFREQIGLYFEDLIPGEIYDHRPARSFSAEENRLHALRALEINPQYSDEHYADIFTAGKIPINEAFLVGTITALTTRTFDRVVANLGWSNIQLLAPVYTGDTIYAASTILDKRESHSRPTQGIMHVETRAFNQHNHLVCKYERNFLVYKKGLGPYQAAGY
jgi:itaconyl-CoA hydratase